MKMVYLCCLMYLYKNLFDFDYLRYQCILYKKRDIIPGHLSVLPRWKILTLS